MNGCVGLFYVKVEIVLKTSYGGFRVVEDA